MPKESKRISSLFSEPFVRAAAFLTCCFLSQPAFAQYGEGYAKMESAATKALEIFKSPLVKAILAISFCCCAVAYAMNKDNEKVKRGALAVGIATVMIIAAVGIVEFLMET